jgi:glycosyltransferase involved in cell wall biosynthesis
MAYCDVTVILLTYNRQSFLPRTLDSILDQSYKKFNLLICDDYSTDGTERICREYAQRDSRIKYCRNAVNVGMPGNLNAGIQRANTEFVAILHDGDIYAEMLLEKWRGALVKHRSAGFVFNVYRHLTDDGETRGLTDRFPEFIPGRQFLDICLKDREFECPVWGTVMARRDVFDTLGLFDARYSFWSDFDMWFRIAEHYDVAFVPEVLIDLPSKRVMPHLFDVGAVRMHGTIFQMYWAARYRRYQGQPILLTKELAKQVLRFIQSRGRRIARRMQISFQDTKGAVATD